MNGVVRGKGHKSPKDYNPNLYKVILTKVDMLNGKAVTGKDILSSVYLREPIAEVWVDFSTHNIVKILDMPEEIMYKGVPVAVY